MATEIQTLEPKAQLNITTQPQNFTGAMQELGRSSNLLGELGASVALNSSIEYNKIQGEKLGLNPQGSLLPPITAADKAFAQGYIAQSNATLSLQANKLMIEGQSELNKNYQLSPSLIQSYTSNMQKGLEQIIEQAPEQLQMSLRNNFNKTLLNQSGALTNQYISQSKKREIEEAQANLKLQLKQINDFAQSGETDAANKLKEQVINESNARKNTGMYSPTTAQTAIDSANTSYYTALEIKNAELAIQQKRLPEYLDSIALTNVQGQGPTESDAIKANVYNWANRAQGMRSQEQSYLMIEALNHMANGTFTDVLGAKYKDQLDPTNYLKIMTRFAASQKKSSVEDGVVQAIMDDPTNPMVYINASKKQINKSFAGLAQIQNNLVGGRESQEESMLTVASKIPRTIPYIRDAINAGLSSGNPEQMQKWGTFYSRLTEQNPVATMGVTDESLAALDLYKYNLVNAQYKNDPNIAASEAIKQVYNKDEQQIKNNIRYVNDYFNKQAGSTEKLGSWAIKISGLSDSVPIFNRNGFNLDMQKKFMSLMHLTNGNRETAATRTAEYAEKNYGETRVNGSPEIVKYPIGKIIGLEHGADGLIQYDAALQLEAKFKEHKQAFDDKKEDYYYKLKDIPNYQEYLSAKNIANKKGWLSSIARFTSLALSPTAIPLYNDTEYRKSAEIIKSFENPKQLTIQQIGRSGIIKEMKLYIQPSPNMSMSADGAAIGGYLPMAIDERTSMPITLRGYFGPGEYTPVINPNVNWIRNNYLNVNGIINTTWAEHEKQRKINEERLAKIEVALYDPLLLTYGTGLVE